MTLLFFCATFAFADNFKNSSWEVKGTHNKTIIIFMNDKCIIDRKTQFCYYNYTEGKNYIQIGGFGYRFNKVNDEYILTPAFENGNIIVLTKIK